MRTKWAGKAEATGFILYALVFGFFGFTLMFTNLHLGNGFWSSSLRLLLLIGFYFVAAIPIGYFDHKWWPISGFLAWTPIVVALIGIFWSFEKRSLGEYLMMTLIFLLPLGISLAGGWFGAYRYRRRNPDEADGEEADERGLHGHFPRLLQ